MIDKNRILEEYFKENYDKIMDDIFNSNLSLCIEEV